MTIINPKSISGITSITTASGADNLLTVHTNNTTERIRINNDGDVIVGSGITVSPDGDIFATGVTTSTTFVGALTGNVTGNVSGSSGSATGNAGGLTGTPNISVGTIAGSTGTFTGDVDIADKIVHTGDTDTAIRFPASDTITAETGGSERIRIKSNGYVGIGTNNPQRPFVISNSGAAGVEFNIPDGNGGLSLNLYNRVTTGYDPLTFNASYFVFGPGATEKIRIDSSGRLLIGSTDATVADSSIDDLIVGSGTNGTNDGITIFSGTGQNGTLAFADSGGATQGLVGYVHNGDYLRLHAGNTLKVRIDTDGLKFNSDTAAANALNDYEEGSWTVNDLGGSAYNVASGSVGKYVKVGGVVHAWAQFGTDTSGNVAVGDRVNIGDLPFNANTIGNPAVTVSINYSAATYSTAKGHVTSSNEITFTVTQTTGHARSGAGYYIAVSYYTDSQTVCTSLNYSN